MKEVDFELGKAIQPRKEKVNPADYARLPYVGLEHIEAHTTKLVGTASADSMRSTANRFYAGDVLCSRLRPYLTRILHKLHAPSLVY